MILNQVAEDGFTKVVWINLREVQSCNRSAQERTSARHADRLVDDIDNM